MKYRIKTIKNQSYEEFVPQYKRKYGLFWHSFLCSAACGVEITNVGFYDFFEAMDFIDEAKKMSKKHDKNLSYIQV